MATGCVGFRRLQTYRIMKMSDVPRNGSSMKNAMIYPHIPQVHICSNNPTQHNLARTHSTTAPKKSMKA